MGAGVLEASRKYNPDALFQSGRAGGFKLDIVERQGCGSRASGIGIVPLLVMFFEASPHIVKVVAGHDHMI